MGLVFVVLAVVFIGYNNIVLIKVIAKIWKYDDIATTRSDVEINGQTVKQGVNNGSARSSESIYLKVKQRGKTPEIEIPLILYCTRNLCTQNNCKCGDSQFVKCDLYNGFNFTVCLSLL